jgi:hypothetical protein
MGYMCKFTMLSKDSPSSKPDKILFYIVGSEFGSFSKSKSLYISADLVCGSISRLLHIASGVFFKFFHIILKLYLK